MKKMMKDVSGHAYLAGGKKSTIELIEMVSGAFPEEKRASIKKQLETRLIVPFSEKRECTIPETFEEAVSMLPNEMESVTKSVISKATTNQQDKYREEIIKGIVEKADVKAFLAEVFALITANNK